MKVAVVNETPCLVEVIGTDGESVTVHVVKTGQVTTVPLDEVYDETTDLDRLKWFGDVVFGLITGRPFRGWRV